MDVARLSSSDEAGFEGFGVGLIPWSIRVKQALGLRLESLLPALVPLVERLDRQAEAEGISNTTANKSASSPAIP